MSLPPPLQAAQSVSQRHMTMPARAPTHACMQVAELQQALQARAAAKAAKAAKRKRKDASPGADGSAQRKACVPSQEHQPPQKQKA